MMVSLLREKIARSLSAIRGAKDNVSGQSLNDLVNLLHQVEDLSFLKQEFDTDDETYLRNMSWIASEMGNRAIVFEEEICKLLNHDVDIIRFNCVDAVISFHDMAKCTTISMMLCRLTDDNVGVRAKVCYFLSTANTKHIERGLAQLPNQMRSHARRCSTVLRSVDRGHLTKLASSLRASADFVRFFALGMCGRTRHLSKSYLQVAVESEEIKLSATARALFILLYPMEPN